jgi:hypothetical protein
MNTNKGTALVSTHSRTLRQHFLTDLRRSKVADGLSEKLETCSLVSEAGLAQLNPMLALCHSLTVKCGT